MVNVASGRYSHDACGRYPTLSPESSKSAIYCKEYHALDGMDDVVNKRCAHEGCSKVPNFGSGGSKTPVYCRQPAPYVMIDVKSRRCAHEGCGVRPSSRRATRAARTAASMMR